MNIARCFIGKVKKQMFLWDQNISRGKIFPLMFLRILVDVPFPEFKIKVAR